MIDRREPVVRPGVKEFGCVGRLALNAKQNIECSSAGWRNRRSRALSLGFHSRQYDGSGRGRGEIRVALHPELLAGPRTIASNELCGRGSLLPFQLNFEKFDRGLAAAADKKTIAFRLQLGHWQNPLVKRRLPYLQILSSELRVCPGPGLEATHAVQDLGRRTGEINKAIFFFENGREGGLGMI